MATRKVSLALQPLSAPAPLPDTGWWLSEVLPAGAMGRHTRLCTLGWTYPGVYGRGTWWYV